MLLWTDRGTPLWLAYGMNVHPGGDEDALERAIRTTVLPLRDRLGATGPFGVSLRFDGAAVDRLGADDARLVRLRGLLAGHGLVPFTANGFVVGTFHGGVLKDEVYRPSWRDRERVAYTNGLAGVMAALRGPGEVVSVSTLPGSYRGWEEGVRVREDCARNYVRTARHLEEIEKETGTRVLLAIEAEPRCTIETTAETVAFFQGPLAEALGRDSGALRHLGVCFDVCHQSVVHEDVVASLGLLRSARIPVFKLQASCALEVPDPRDPAAIRALGAFAEPTYLHQVGALEADGSLRVADDLARLLERPGDPLFGRRPWRVHFHVPVFRETSVPPLWTTRPDLDRALEHVARDGGVEHLEIETYTWDVLPDAERRAGSGSDLVDSLEREYRHVLSVLERSGVRRERPAAVGGP
jgi:hypothetical protein